MSIESGLALSPQSLDRLFPFHIALNNRMQIVRAGSTLRRICPGLETGCDICELFSLERPAVDLTFEVLANQEHTLCVLLHRDGKLRLRGQFQTFSESGILLFLGSPWVQNPSELLNLGLSLDDFPLHEPVADLLQLVQMQNSSLSDLRVLTNRLRQQKDEVRQKNEELLQQFSNLERSQELIKSILDTAPDAVMTIDGSGVIEMVNPAAETLFGYGPGELNGQKVNMLMPPPHSEQHDAYVSRYIQTGEARIIGKGREVVGRRRDGTTVPLYLSIGLVSNTKPYRFVGILHDITEQKNAEEQLSRAKEQAESANRAKSEFLATVSHEMRTPLNAILGMTELCLDTELSLEQRRLLDTVQASGELLLHLISDLLDLSKIEAGQIDIDRRPMDLPAVMEQTRAQMGPRACEKGLDLICETFPEAPASLLGDPLRLQQVLTNLVGNAIKFTEAGEVRVRMDAAQAEGQSLVALRITVSDTGIGISPEHLSEIFEKFVQVDRSLTRRRHGAGLGLHISKLLVESMGGGIWVESEEGKGSTFHIEMDLPRAEREMLVSTALDAASENSTPTEKALLPHVLVAEDSDDNYELVERTLTDAGFVVERAENGDVAVEKAKQLRYDLVLMDLEMPEMDGFTATRMLRSWERESKTDAVPIVALTAHGTRECRERCQAEGMNDFLVKPVTKERLVGAARKRLDWRPVVLVVDDSPDLRELTQRYLEETDAYRLLIAEDGKAAIHTCGWMRPSLILLDMEMYPLDGYGTARAIRQNPKNGSVLIVAMTGHTGTEARQRCLEAGCTDHLAKPFSRVELLEILEKHLGRHRPDSLDMQEADHPVIPDVDPDIADLLPGYLTHRADDIEKIRAALETGDMETIQILGHSMKGSGLGYGLSEVGEIGRLLELAAKRAERVEIAAFADRLETYLQRVRLPKVQ
jgi:PAS domain S-box-containing protein